MENSNASSKNKLPKFDWRKFRLDRITYHWQFYSEEHDHHFEYDDECIYKEGALLAGHKKEECLEVKLYKSPEKPPYDRYIQHSNWQLHLLVEYFKEVFEEKAFIEGRDPSHVFQVLVLPSRIYHEILNTINDYELLHVKDLLLESIAIAQKIYVEDVFHWEKPDNQKLIASAEKEVGKVIQVIQQSRTDWKSWSDYEGKVRPKLEHIKFVFNTGTIKLEHEWLAREVH